MSCDCNSKAKTFILEMELKDKNVDASKLYPLDFKCGTMNQISVLRLIQAQFNRDVGFEIYTNDEITIPNKIYEGYVSNNQFEYSSPYIPFCLNPENATVYAKHYGYVSHETKN